MKFTKLVVAVALISLSAQSKADDGMLRRNDQVAQADQTTTVNSNKDINSTKEVIVINTQPQAVTQPATTVEAQPAVESKAEILRKERERAEVQTEQKIVEKLEDSRLQEERARAERLFGNKLDPQQLQPQQEKPAAAAVVVPVTPPPAQPVAAPDVQQNKDIQPTQVNIEKADKVEIVQPGAAITPAPEAAAPAPVPAPIVEEKKVEDKPIVAVEEAKTDAPAPAEKKQKFFVEGMAGNLAYAASNVKSNYGVGVGVGMIFNDQYALELSYMYSNHDISDVWSVPVWHTLDQNDISASGKYYFLQGKLKPYAGASLTWINRNYTDRYFYNYSAAGSTSTNAVDAGVLAGVDFAITDSVLIGAGFDYNFNVMTTDNINYASYGLPPGVQELEKISYTTIKVSAKFVF